MKSEHCLPWNWDFLLRPASSSPLSPFRSVWYSFVCSELRVELILLCVLAAAFVTSWPFSLAGGCSRARLVMGRVDQCVIVPFTALEIWKVIALGKAEIN